MYNDDLKRFYQVNSTPEMLKDFARYTKNGTLQSANPLAQSDVVTLEYLKNYSGGTTSDLNYKGVWVSGDEIYKSDVVYVDNTTRIFYKALNDITESTISPENDSTNWEEILEVPLANSNGQITSVVYDDTTLVDHITEILGHTNTENGGTLLKVGFKIGSASVAANGTKTTISNGTSPTVETSSVSVFGASRFYSFTASDIMTENGTTTLTLAGPNGLSGASQSVIEITSTSDNATQTCSVSGSTTIVNGANIEITAFSGIDLLSIPLEHLIIDYYTT